MLGVARFGTGSRTGFELGLGVGLRIGMQNGKGSRTTRV